jgi:hypothetical protein
MSLNTTDISNGVSISGSTDPFNTYIKTENAGVYNIQFSAQVDKTDSGTDEIWIWLRKNGTNLTDTATSIQLVGNGAHYVAAWNFFVNAAANDYYQLMWYSPDGNVRLHAEPAFGVVPGIPSLIVTVNRIDQFLSNTGSFSGSFTGQFTGSLQGTSSWSINAITASYADNFTVAGTITAQKLVVQTITSSVLYSSGSNIFGNDINNTQTFTGSLQITGSVRSTGNIITSGSLNILATTGQTLYFTNTGQIGSSGTGYHIQISPGSNTTLFGQVVTATNGLNVTPGVNSTTQGLVVTSGSYPAATLLRVGVNSLVVTGSTVGIGTLTPVSALHISGASSAALFEIDSPAINNILFVSGSGNIGIGTGTPNARLDVKGNTIISGSLAVGTDSIGASENTITLGARDAINEGGQIGFNAPGGTYTSASFIDNWQNKARILKGNNTTSTGLIAQWDIHTTQMQLPGYTAASSFPGTATANLAVDSGGNIITVSTSGGTVFPYTGNAVITGSLTATTGFIAPNTNNAMYLRGGDDVELWDINISNHLGIYGQQDATISSIKLGSGGGVISGKSNNIGIGTLTPNAKLDVNGNAIITGSLTVTAGITGSITSASYALTASYAMNGGGGGSAFPYTGDAVIVGSLTNGIANTSFGIYSHAQGTASLSSGSYSHAEGAFTVAVGSGAHTEGALTTAIGIYSHAEGYFSTAIGIFSHTEGNTTTAFGSFSHAEGERTVAVGQQSHAEGRHVTASGDYSHAEGRGTRAIGVYSHAEGQNNTAIGNYSHVEGNATTANGLYSHAEGFTAIALGDYSHAEGNLAIASGSFSHAEGQQTTTLGNNSHVEGYFTTTTNQYTHAEGQYTIASGQSAHAEGENTTAIGFASHAEGKYTTSIGINSHAEGYGTITSGDYQHAQGTYNISSSNPYAFIIGNGTDGANRSNLIYASGSSVQITGSLDISGSVVITGSVIGNVTALTISSNTASLNLNNGNFFTLQLVSGSNTFINPSNIKSGQTTNILISTTGSATVSFPSTVKQVTGSLYVPTTTTGTDIVTLVSFDTTSLYLANVKNLA